MHRNTYLLVTFLAIFAALVVGVNLGRKITSPSSPGPTPVPTIITSPTPVAMRYTDETCGFTLTYPTSLTQTDGASGSALLLHATNRDQSIAIACQADIPRPPLASDRIETRVITNESGTASVAAKLYHDASAKDGTPRDELLFTHPTSGLDIFIAGFGETFDSIIDTVKLIP